VRFYILPVTLVPKLQLGNLEAEAPASQDGKLELPIPNSQAGAWELAITCWNWVSVNEPTQLGWVSDSVTQHIQEQSPKYSGGEEMSGYGTLTLPTTDSNPIYKDLPKGWIIASLIKLDELLAQVDIIKTRLDAIPKILKHFRQSVLAAAVSGKLTEDWRKTEILKNWIETNIGQLSLVSTGKTPIRSETAYWDYGTVPWLTSATTGKEFCYKAEQFVTEFAVKKCSLKIFSPGTLLLAMYGEGKTRGQVTELKLNATCNQACAAIIVDEKKALRSFVKLRLQENYEETRKAASGGNQPNLNLNKIRDISVLLPPLEEQTEIVNRVEQLFTYADQIEQRVKDAQARINHLTQAILAKAFRGELTADWREQNPGLISGENSAEALLAKIKTEREREKAKKSTRQAKSA